MRELVAPIADRLRTTVGVRAARLTMLAPTAIIADVIIGEVLGYSPPRSSSTPEDRQANYATYISARLDARS